MTVLSATYAAFPDLVASKLSNDWLYREAE